MVNDISEKRWTNEEDKRNMADSVQLMATPRYLRFASMQMCSDAILADKAGRSCTEPAQRSPVSLSTITCPRTQPVSNCPPNLVWALVATADWSLGVRWGSQSGRRRSSLLSSYLMLLMVLMRGMVTFGDPSDPLALASFWTTSVIHME